MIEILSAFGLSAATGLNAYLPLLIVGLFSRFTDWITLKAPWNTLENTWVLLVLAILLVIEMTVDKIPAVDTLNDVIQTFIRPAAGAILFASGSNWISEISPVAAMICGLVVAGKRARRKSFHAAYDYGRHGRNGQSGGQCRRRRDLRSCGFCVHRASGSGRNLYCHSPGLVYRVESALAPEAQRGDHRGYPLKLNAIKCSIACAFRQNRISKASRLKSGCTKECVY